MVDFAFLDSGTGGIPYLAYLLAKSPDSKCVYIGDTKNFPYGEKTHDEIVSCVLDVVKKIKNRFNPKVIVLACNTMSVNTLDVVREVFPEVQFVGTVPAIKVAGDNSKKRCIGLLATNATCNHPYNQDLKNHFAKDCKMVLRGDPELISFIEHDSFTASEKEVEEAVKPSVDFFRKEGCDEIILGCTHFLNLVDVFKKIAAPDIEIVDSREGVVNRALSLVKGVAGMCPAEGVTEKATAQQGLCSQGEAYPSKSLLYVTGFSDKKDEKEYDVICKRYDLIFGGKL
ncbi:MAG: glutamate racemase [Treponema sp.]|nr:glutamate racemase [Treponema sp.]